MKNLVFTLLFLFTSQVFAASPEVNCTETNQENAKPNALKSTPSELIIIATDKEALDKLTSAEGKEFKKLLFKVSKQSGFTVNELLTAFYYQYDSTLDNFETSDVSVLKMLFDQKVKKETIVEIHHNELNELVDMEFTQL